MLRHCVRPSVHAIACMDASVSVRSCPRARVYTVGEYRSLHACLYTSMGTCILGCNQGCVRAILYARANSRCKFSLRRRGAVVKGVRHFDNCVSQHLSGAGSSSAGSVGRDLNLQKKLNYQYATTSVAVVLVVR